MDTSQPIFVTGANGWLGFSLVRALVQGLPDFPGLNDSLGRGPISCLILPEDDPARLVQLGSRVRIVTGDLRSAADCKRLFEGSGKTGGVLFHTAGVIHPQKATDFYSINTRGTETVLEHAVAAGVKRAVVVSSNSPCGCNPHPDHRFDEESSYNPYLGYGRSKMLMEEAVRRVAREHSPFETVIIRAPWFYGPYQPARQTLFFKMVREGKAPLVGDGENLRSMCYLDNLVQGLIRAATAAKAVGKVYWIADSEPYKMRNIIDTIEQVLRDDFKFTTTGKRLRLPSIASKVAYLTDLLMQKCGLYNQKIHVLSEMNKTIACSVERAKRELGYQPSVALREGMRRSIEWCVANKMEI